MTYRYRPHVLEEMAAHGVVPRPDTPPRLLKDFINDLYRYELRELRAGLIGGAIQKRDYSRRVVDLRKRYLLLSVPLHFWTL